MNAKAVTTSMCGFLVSVSASSAPTGIRLAAQQVPGHVEIVFSSTQHADCPTEPGRACELDDVDGELYVMNRKGHDQTRITFDHDPELGAVWAPDDTRIAFYSARGGVGQIFLMNPDGTGQMQLTGTGPLTDTGMGAQFPDWSPDGQKIVFQTNPAKNGAFTYRDIYVINVDGTGLTNLTHNATYQDMRPAWSPKGDRIVFGSNRDFNDEIYVMNADGSNQTRLTSDAAADQAPDWSPDGSKIVFQSNRDGNVEIWVMNADGSDPLALTHTASPARNLDPAWSPDGQQIAFDSDRAFPSPVPNGGIRQVFVMNSDGTSQQSLTSLPGESGHAGWGWVSDEVRQSNAVAMIRSRATR